MSEKHTRDALHSCACASISTGENVTIGVGSSVPTFSKTVVCVAFAAAFAVAFAVARSKSAELAPPEVKGLSEKYRMMRTDKYQYQYASPFRGFESFP